MSATGPKAPRTRHERAPLIVAGAIIVVIGIAALSSGGAIVWRKPSAGASVGHAFYPLEDGITCRDVTFDLASGTIVSSSVRPCAGRKIESPSRKFTWGH